MSDEFIPRIIKGDFFQEYKKHLRARSVDLFLSDVPYGLFTNHQDLTGVADPKLNLDKLERSLDYILTRSATVLLFCDLDLLIRLRQAFDKFNFRWEYVLNKNNGSPTHKTRPLNNIEYIAVFKRTGVKATDLIFNPYESGQSGEPYIKRNYNRNQATRKIKKRKIDINQSGKRYIKQSLKMAGKCNLKDTEKTPHPFQKPEQLLRILIKVHSDPKSLIVDGFAGSGSTAIAAYKENRRSVLFEISDRWFKVAKDRIRQETSKLKLFGAIQ
jgi:site-specific DNA-methyltransferase (adenine-specific)